MRTDRSATDRLMAKEVNQSPFTHLESASGVNVLVGLMLELGTSETGRLDAAARCTAMSSAKREAVTT